MTDSTAARCEPPPEFADRPYHWLDMGVRPGCIAPYEWSPALRVWATFGLTKFHTPEWLAEQGWSWLAVAEPPVADGVALTSASPPKGPGIRAIKREIKARDGIAPNMRGLETVEIDLDLPGEGS